MPEEIITFVKSFVPIYVIYITNKDYFYTYYPLIVRCYNLKNHNFQTYLRRLVRRDCWLQMEVLLTQKFDEWILTRKWRYKLRTYPNFVIYLKDLCIEGSSQACRQLIDKRLLDTRLYSVNRHKKIKHKNIKWSN